MKIITKEKIDLGEDRIEALERGYRAILAFVDKIENLSQFQDRLEIPASIDQIWDAFLDDIKNIIETSFCAIFLVDEETNEFVLRGVTEPDNESICQDELNSQIECGIFSWIINRRKPAIISSLVLKNDLSIVMIPLTTVKRTLGVILIATAVDNQEITNESLQLLTMLGRQCSLVIENTLLYSRLKKEQKFLNEAQARTLQAEKLASLGRLTDGAFHEILNPLNIISGHIQVLQKDELLSSRVSKYLANMKEQSERIARIVNGLLHFSRHCEYERGKFNINEIIESVLILLHNELMLNNIIVSKKLLNDLPEIFGNEEQISQVLYNLIFNARDAMAEGGTLEISTGIAPVNNDRKENNEFIQINIKDTGCGIPKKSIDKIFDPFFTTKETGKGTGLGLSLTYGIIEEHGGKIFAGNNPGKGAFFSIQLPVAG